MEIKNMVKGTRNLKSGNGGLIAVLNRALRDDLV